MKKVRKLTPATLKRIIAEEKYKMLLEEKKQTSSKKKLQSYSRILSILSEQRNKKSKQLNYIDRIRKLIKKSISEER